MPELTISRRSGAFPDFPPEMLLWNRMDCSCLGSAACCSPGNFLFGCPIWLTYAVARLCCETSEFHSGCQA